MHTPCTFPQIYKYDEFYATTNNSANVVINFAIKTISIQFSLDFIPFLFVLTDLTVEFVRPNWKNCQNIQQKPKIAKICIFSKKTLKYAKKYFIFKKIFWLALNMNITELLRLPKKSLLRSIKANSGSNF